MTPTERNSMLQVISDLSKDARGYRVRYDYTAMSDAELQATWDGFIEEAEAADVREAQMKLDAQRRWEHHIASLVAMGAGSRSAALRWDLQAHGIKGDDIGYYCYLNDLDYALEHRIEKELR